MPLQPTDRGQFGHMLTSVGALYGREVSPDLLELYWNALQAYDLSAIRQAFDRHVKNPDAGQFFPKPADLIRMLGGTTTDSAMRAWARVERAIRLVGSYTDVVFDDPMIHRTVDDLGGWIKLCALSEDELPFTAKKFEALYRGYAMRRETPPYPGQLTGRINLHNMAKGHPAEPPHLIGDPAACQQVCARALTTREQIEDQLATVKRLGGQ